MDRRAASANIAADGPVKAEFVTLSDGRRLAFARYGQLAGAPVLALHGTPGSRTKYALGDRIARDLGLCLISVDRWGYGQSDPCAVPSFAQFARDMQALMISLGHPRFSIVGISGGGPFAAATAVYLGDRIERLALVGPVADVGGIHAPADRMGWFHWVCFRLVAARPWMVAGFFGGFRLALKAAPDLALRIATARAKIADRAVIRDDRVRQSLAATFQEGLCSGVRGPVCDLKLFSRPWPFDIGEVRAQTSIWMGDEDRNVPLGPIRALAGARGDFSLNIKMGQGHYWLARDATEVMRWLAAANSTFQRNTAGR